MPFLLHAIKQGRKEWFHIAVSPATLHHNVVDKTKPKVGASCLGD